MRNAFIDLVADADADPEVNAVVITATDPVFSAGVDFKESMRPTTGDGAPAVRSGERLAGGRLEGPKDVALSPSAVVDLLGGTLGWPVGVRRHGPDELLAGEALGRLRTHLVEADDDGALRRRRVEPLDGPLFSAKSGSTRSPNQVS